MSTAQKTILPRKRRLEMLQKEPIPDDYCTICFANPGDHALMPCTHGFVSEIVLFIACSVVFVANALFFWKYVLCVDQRSTTER